MRHEDLPIHHEEIFYSSDVLPISAHFNCPIVIHDSAWHEELEIKYILSGSDNIMINGQLYSAKAGDIVVINPYEVHSTVVTGQEGQYNCLAFCPDRLFQNENEKSVLRSLSAVSNIRFHHIIRNESISGLLRQICEELSNQPENYAVVVRGLFMTFFIFLLRTAVDESSASPKLQQSSFPQVAPAIQEIADHYSEELDVDHLAGVCHLSKYYFSRVFREVTGKSPMQYLMNFRLEIARSLLLQGTYSVSEVSQAVGFHDQAYFSRCYKKQMGISPNQT